MKRFWTMTMALVASMAVGCSSSGSGTTAATGGDITGADVITDTVGTDGSDGSEGSSQTDATDGSDNTDGSTGTVTGADVIIASPDTSTGGGDVITQPVATCGEAILCRLRCGNDTACAEACVDGAEQGITDSLSGLDACVAEKCPGDDPKQCWLDSDICFAEFHACFFDGQTGDKDCEKTYECYADCVSDVETAFEQFDQPLANSACQNGCLQSATYVDQQALVTWAFCVVEFCSSQPGLTNCQKTAEGNVCGSARDQCINFQ